jgi:hypothetical protein
MLPGLRQIIGSLHLHAHCLRLQTLMIIFEINFTDAAIDKPKRNSPVIPQFYGPNTPPLALQLMKVEGRLGQVGYHPCCIQRRKKQLKAFKVLGIDATRIVGLIKSPQASVWLKPLNHLGLKHR